MQQHDFICIIIQHDVDDQQRVVVVGRGSKFAQKQQFVGKFDDEIGSGEEQHQRRDDAQRNYLQRNDSAKRHALQKGLPLRPNHFAAETRVYSSQISRYLLRKKVSQSCLEPGSFVLLLCQIEIAIKMQLCIHATPSHIRIGLILKPHYTSVQAYWCYIYL